MRARLLPLATVVTPNLLEAELLTGLTITDETQMLAAARAILAMGPQWVLVKGGHLAGSPVDLLVTEMAVIAFDHGSAILLETAPDVTVDQIVAATEAQLVVPSNVAKMPV